MIIKDSGGKYELKVDKTRRIVYETNTGLWDEQDYKNYDNEYRNKIAKHLGSGKWIKQCDMRGYRPSTKVTPDLVNTHVKFAMSVGCKGSALIVDSATLKMQINRATNKEEWLIDYFDNTADADAWFKSQGF